LCFGLAGGIGAGISFCPSVVRYGGGSGLWIVGRHKAYATGSDWYQDAFDRLGVTTRVTETGGPGKAYQNLLDELSAGRPAVVWASRLRLPFLGCPVQACDLWMHEFVVFDVDESAGIAYGSDRSAQPVTIRLDDLAAARNGICSHKNRTLTIDPPAAISLPKLRTAVVAGARACASELIRGRMKTYSLPGLEMWAQRVANTKSKEGWPVIYQGHLMYDALRDVFDSIETSGTGGGLYRPLFVDFLEEAAVVTGAPAWAALATTYRELGEQWTELAEVVLSDKVAVFKKTKAALRKRCQLFEQKGQKADAQIAAANATLAGLAVDVRKQFPLDAGSIIVHLERLRGLILELHRAEAAAAEALAKTAA
jgi:hypothetical protein